MTARKWRSEKIDSLFFALLGLKTLDEMANFCRDLMTDSEIEELANRWNVVLNLDYGYSQRQAAKLAGVSIATVTRVNYWLSKGTGGYKLALKRYGHLAHNNQNLRELRHNLPS